MAEKTIKELEAEVKRLEEELRKRELEARIKELQRKLGEPIQTEEQRQYKTLEDLMREKAKRELHDRDYLDYDPLAWWRHDRVWPDYDPLAWWKHHVVC